jgi:hypothetical protein
MDGLAGDAIVAGGDSLEARLCAHGGPPHRAVVVEAARRVGPVAARMPRLGALHLQLGRQRSPALLGAAFHDEDEDGGLRFGMNKREACPKPRTCPGTRSATPSTRSFAAWLRRYQ